jgi:Domain of unknown function (DUF1510)
LSNNVNSRFEKRDKRRKTNIVLNVLIGIVAILILVIGSQLILGGSAEKTAKYNEQPDIKLANEENSSEKAIANKKTDEEENEITTEEDEEVVSEENKEEIQEETSEDPFEQAVITEGEAGSGVAETIENPGWAPIGTSQTEPHAADYTKGSQDWNEMTQALSYATGIPESDMIIWFLGNNGGPNDAVGTISPKDQSVKYKVYINWVENEGWRPTKIEKLN